MSHDLHTKCVTIVAVAMVTATTFTYFVRIARHFHSVYVCVHVCVSVCVCVCVCAWKLKRGKGKPTFLFFRSSGGALYMFPEKIISVDVALTRTKSVAIFNLPLYFRN